jgi:RNA polymerase sigma-70 factor, ECF subfamily
MTQQLPHTHPDDDAELVQQSQKGCTDCLTVLFHRYHRLVLTIAWRVVRQRCEAEELVQDVFLAILMNEHPYEVSRGSVKTWIAQLAYFKALMRRRSIFSRKLTVLEEAVYIRSGNEFHDFALRPPEQTALVEQCLASLNARQRRTVELIHFEGYTLLEAASILKETLANTRNQYYRGIDALRKLLRFPQARKSISAVNQERAASREPSDSLASSAEI